MNAELYFVARFKAGCFLFLTHGPFFEEEQARVICSEQKNAKCYSEVVKVELPFVVVGSNNIETLRAFAELKGYN